MAPVPERTLILGTSARLPIVLRELDAYAARGSETTVIGEGDPTAIVGEVDAELRNMKLHVSTGDVTDRDVLEGLELSRYDQVVVLSETEGRTQEMADARTTVTLLYLRDLQRPAAIKVPVTSEILEIQNRNLAAVAEPDDFIVSNTLISLLVAQVAENPHLMTVFDQLFSAAGHELYLRPATDYVTAGELPFTAVSEAALRRGEIAVGYRLAADAQDATAGYGVVLNPTKRNQVRLGPRTRSSSLPTTELTTEPTTELTTEATTELTTELMTEGEGEGGRRHRRRLQLGWRHGCSWWGDCPGPRQDQP